MSYTEREIKLYGDLARINCIKNKMLIVSGNNFKELIEIEVDNNKGSKWVTAYLNNLIDLDNALNEAKIPSKFLILNGLGDKNGDD